MARMRFTGPEPAYVTPLDRTVQPDEIVELDDSLIHRPVVRDESTGEVTDEGNETGYVWPEELWTNVGGRSKTKASDAAADDTKEK